MMSRDPQTDRPTCFNFCFNGHPARALASGALHLPQLNVLVVSDLHLGRSERIARRGGGLLPPYENSDTIARLLNDIRRAGPATVVCLGDSFDDDIVASSVSETYSEQIASIQSNRRWIWVSGNHDPGSMTPGGEVHESFSRSNLVFRHIASPGCTSEISGHYHPKATVSFRGRRITRPCFLVDHHKIILPAYGTYTGGLSIRDAAFAAIVGEDAFAILTGTRAMKVPAAA